MTDGTAYRARLRSRKGSYIMEAAVVLPVIIFVLITIVLIVMFFYSQITERSRLHIAMRCEAGLAAGSTVYGDSESSEDTDAEIYTEKTVSGSEASGRKYLIMKYRGILEKKGIFVVEGKCSGTDGARYVRYYDLIKGIGNEE